MKENNSSTIQKAYSIYQQLYLDNISKDKRKELLKQYFSLVKKAAYAGNTEGMYLLGIIYQDEQMILKIRNYTNKISCQKRAFYWFEKACKQNHPYACHNLAGFYSLGEIVEKNEKKEIKLYLKSFSLGLSESGYALAILYRQRSNFKKSVFWLNKVLEMEANDGEAIFELAKFYYEGKGVKKSYKRAHELFVKAITTNYITQYTKEEIFFYLGKMYFYGQYVEKSISKAKYLIGLSNVDRDHEYATKFYNENLKLFKEVKKEKFSVV